MTVKGQYGTGEMVQCLKALVALVEDPGFIFNTYVTGVENQSITTIYNASPRFMQSPV